MRYALPISVCASRVASTLRDRRFPILLRTGHMSTVAKAFQEDTDLHDFMTRFRTLMLGQG